MATIGIMLVRPTLGQIIARAAAEQRWFEEQMGEIGHKTHTTLWRDFTIADYKGTAAVTDTYNRVVRENATNEKMIAELYIVLNWKVNTFYEKNDTLANHYNELYERCYTFATENLKGEKLSYFFQTTD